MHPKKFFFLTAFVLGANAASVTLYSYTIDATKTTLQAQKRVVVEYKNYFIAANRAEYDRSHALVKLFGNIVIIDDKKYSALGNFALLDLQSDTIVAEPFFFHDYASKVWIAGTKMEANEQKVSIANAYVSSCDVRCADWRIYFANGSYDEQKKWIDLYNVRFYLQKTPLLYLPYLGFSTSKKRHSGFLRPTLGLSQNEGFIYIQPYYYAPENWWDLEIDPQIRTDRGYGLYSTLRFVDSSTSTGRVRAGIFNEKSKYLKNRKIKNKKHYGLEVFYTRDNLFTKSSKQNFYDGIYIDTKSYNDINYFTLQKNSDVVGVDSQIISRFNYVFTRDSDYFGLYAKYFKDNRKLSNSDTLQLLPALHYHKYETNIFNKHIAYKADITVSHYYRNKGLNALEYRLNLPIKFYTQLYNDYLGFSITENLFFDYATYSNRPSSIKNSSILRNAHTISLYSDLTKRYPTFLHTLFLKATLNIPSFEKKSGQKADFINIEDRSKRLDLSLQEYFYDKNGNTLHHRLIQPIAYEKSQKFRDLENEIGVKLGEKFTIDNNIFFSHQKSRISSIVTTFSYQDELYNLFLSHFYKRAQTKADFIRLQGDRVLSKKNKLFATIDYDIRNDSFRSWSIGFNIDKGCWGLYISYKDEVVPLLTELGSNSYNNRTIYFKIDLYPLGGISKSFIQSDYEKAL